MPQQHINIIAQDISELRHPVTNLLKGAVILFASPQFLTSQKGSSIIDESTSALHMTVMDEVHIGSQFGEIIIPMFDKETKEITFKASVSLNESAMYTFQIENSWDKIPKCSQP